MNGKPLTREEALFLLKTHVKNEKFVKHCIAVEAIMRRLARIMDEAEELWGLTGLLHDIDYELTKGRPEVHGLLAEQILKDSVPEPVLKAIKSHNYERNGFNPVSKLDKALIAADAVSGLLVACALVMPSKKMSEVKLRTVLRKFKSKDFARGVDRRRIMFCEQVGLGLEMFLKEALNSLKEAASELGL